jgi:hypothetical protein
LGFKGKSNAAAKHFEKENERGTFLDAVRRLGELFIRVTSYSAAGSGKDLTALWPTLKSRPQCKVYRRFENASAAEIEAVKYALETLVK